MDDTNPANPTPATAEAPAEKGSRIKKADKIAVTNCVSSSFMHNFPQMSTEDIQGLVKYFGELMCRKLAKTPLYQSTGTITVQGMRDAFGAVLVDRILHKETVLNDSVPTSPESAAVVCGMASPFDGPAEATTPPKEDPAPATVAQPETVNP